MATRGKTFFTQYDRDGDVFMRAQLASPGRDHRRAFRAQIDFPLKGKTLLDAGCGYGHDLPFYAKRGAIVYGSDPSTHMVALARRQHPDCPNLSVQPIHKTSFPGRFFDVITSIYALHNEPDLEPAFRELHLCLKPNGLFVFLVQHPLFVFQLKARKVYHRKGTVTFTIPDMQPPCVIRQPAHTFSEYFTPFVLDRFELLAFAEGREPVPMWFLAKLRKR
ncbi:MAG: class I SAM-dependent methyltransferase [Nitrospiraceae bacterium]